MEELLLNVLLPLIATAASAAGAAFAVYGTYRRVQAERHYVRLLAGHLEHLQSLQARSPEGAALDDEALARISRELERLTAGLDGMDRRLIVRALKQPSHLGRRRYVEKLLRGPSVARTGQAA